MTITRMTVLFASVLISACSAVYSPVPMGEAPVVLDPEQWDGTWLQSDGAMTIEVTDADQGLLKLALVENLEMEIIEIHVRQSGDWMFGSFLEQDDAPDGENATADQPLYLWGRIKNDGGQIVIWPPSPSLFRALVDDGTLPGTVEEQEGFTGANVTLGALTSEHYRIITTGEKGVLMDWDEPEVFIRHSD